MECMDITHGLNLMHQMVIKHIAKLSGGYLEEFDFSSSVLHGNTLMLRIVCDQINVHVRENIYDELRPLHIDLHYDAVNFNCNTLVISVKIFDVDNYPDDFFKRVLLSNL